MCNHDGDVAFAKIGYVGFGEGVGWRLGRVASCFCKKRPNVKLRMSEGQVVTAQGLPNVGDWRGKERERGKRRKRERLLMFRVTDANLAGWGTLGEVAKQQNALKSFKR